MATTSMGCPARVLTVALALALILVLPGCMPHFRHLEHVETVERVMIGGTTRDEVRDRLGVPSLVDTPGLYVYDWEKAKMVAFGYFGSMATAGYTGTRALFVFDREGRVARAEVLGTGQGSGDRGPAADTLPVAAVVPPPAAECADKRALRAWFAGPEPRLLVYVPGEIRVCDARGTEVLGRLAGKFYFLALAAEGRLAATYEVDRTLTLRDGTTLQPIRALAPPAGSRTSVMRWGVGISLSADGGRLAAGIGDDGVTVFDTVSGDSLLRLPDRWSPRLSPDGRLVLTKGKDGFHLAEVDGGREVAMRPPAKYPYGIAPDPYLARRLLVELGTTAFSPDGRRLALATCAHVEVWDLPTLVESGWREGMEEAFLLPFTRVFGVCAASVRFSADGRTLAVANEQTVTLYDLAGHKVAGRYLLPAPVVEMSFTPDLTGATTAVPAGPLLWEVGKVTPPMPEEKPSPPPVAVPTG